MDCRLKHKAQSHSLLFSLEPPLPPELSPAIQPMLSTEDRDKAQKAFVKHIQDKSKVVPLLVAKCVARQVASEIQKMLPNASNAAMSNDIPEADEGEYTLHDHIERLRYLEMTAQDEEINLLREVLRNAFPGLEHFVTDERYATLLGKMAYNSYGVCFGGGRNDKVCWNEVPNVTELESNMDFLYL
jgi:import receptor subunit TOM20